jgi:hypothetical protein
MGNEWYGRKADGILPDCRQTRRDQLRMTSLLGPGGARYTQVLSALRPPSRLVLLAADAASWNCGLACRQSGKGSPPARWGRAPGWVYLGYLSNGMLEYEQRTTIDESSNQHQATAERRAMSTEQRVCDETEGNYERVHQNCPAEFGPA